MMFPCFYCLPIAAETNCKVLRILSPVIRRSPNACKMQKYMAQATEADAITHVPLNGLTNEETVRLDVAALSCTRGAYVQRTIIGNS